MRVARRAEVQAALQAEGVPTAVHDPRALHQQPAYERFAPRLVCPLSEALAASVMSLPMSADLSHADQDRVLQALGRALGRTGSSPPGQVPGP